MGANTKHMNVIKDVCDGFVVAALRRKLLVWNEEAQCYFPTPEGRRFFGTAVGEDHTFKGVQA